jgi:hypothetical protein
MRYTDVGEGKFMLNEEAWKYSFTLTLDGGEWLDSRPCRFTPRKTSRDDWVASQPVWMLWRDIGVDWRIILK